MGLSVLVLISCYTVNILPSLWKFVLIAAGMLLVCEMFLEEILPSRLVHALFLFFFINFISTTVNGNLTSSLIKMYMIAGVYVLWCDFYCRSYTDIFIYSHLVVVGILIVVQLFFQVYDPDLFGITESGNMFNFLVSDNFTGYYFVPLMILAAVASIRKKSKIDPGTWIFIGMGLASIVLSGSGTCIIGGCAFVLMLIISLFFKKKVRFPIILFFAIYLAFLIGILCFSIQDYAADFLGDVLGKSTTLSGRTYIWELVPSYFSERPFLGYGTGTGGRAEVIWIDGSCEAPSLRNKFWNPHNYFLSVLIEGGILQMSAYIIVLIIVTLALRDGRDNMVGNIIKVGILAMFIMYTAEGVILHPAQYLVFILAFYNNKFRRKNYVSETLCNS